MSGSAEQDPSWLDAPPAATRFTTIVALGMVNAALEVSTEDALSMLLDADVQAGLVVDRTGALRGMVTVADITALMREPGLRPQDATQRAAAAPEPGD